MITASDGVVSVFAITSRWAVVGGNYDDLALIRKNVRQNRPLTGQNAHFEQFIRQETF